MKHIRTKFLLLFVSLSVFTLLTVGWLISYEIDTYFKRWMIENLEKLTDIVLTSFVNDTTKNFSYTTSLVKASRIRIKLFDNSNNVLYDSEALNGEKDLLKDTFDHEQISAAKEGKGKSIHFNETTYSENLYITRKIDKYYQRGNLIQAEYIQASIPATDVKQMIFELRMEIIVAAVIVTIIMFIASVFISRSISKPLITIGRAAREIQDGNLDLRINIKSKDEIGEVAQAVNAMVERLNSDIVRLKKLEKIRSEFLGNVSHELRTPIFMLQGYLETLLDGAINDPVVSRDFLEKAHANAMRLNALLQDLIEISRIESGDMKMSFRYFPIVELTENVIEQYRETASSKKLNLMLCKNDVSDEQIVFGDRERLAQVLSNLIDNAIKYTQPGGEVSIHLEHEGEYVRVSVRDTGIGISAEHHDRIFERFYRVDKERSRDAGGTGLGLAIVKHIIEAHNSTITVKSELGKGSIFSFLLKK